MDATKEFQKFHNESVLATVASKYCITSSFTRKVMYLTPLDIGDLAAPVEKVKEEKKEVEKKKRTKYDQVPYLK